MEAKMHVPVDRQTCHVIPDTNRTTRRIRLGVIIIALFVLLSTQATAASFDCKKASTWVEKTVCSDEVLSQFDDQLAKAYHDALASLSPEGQKETKEYQRKWLKDISSYNKAQLKLHFDDNAKYQQWDYALKFAYENRIKQLQESLIKFPDRIFRNVYVHYSKSAKTCPYRVVTRNITYPQIENPRNENEKSWNNFLSKQAIDNFKYDGDCENSTDEYVISFSNKQLISVKRMNSTLTQDALIPARAAAVSISWLLEEKRELQSADLFDDKTDWRDKLEALASAKLEAQMAAQEETRAIHSSELMYKVTSPSEWVILPAGLGFGFFEFYLEGYSIFITIDWKTLTPYLSKKGRSLIYD